MKKILPATFCAAIIILGSLFFLVSSSPQKANESLAPKVEQNTSVPQRMTVLVGGDVMLDRTIAPLVKNTVMISCSKGSLLFSNPPTSVS